ncbi:aminomethyl-transferring glycine dehydrogenase subunit GcvPA [Candidatus Fermentibacterales bacterium]|nr:aminomethyl-transferring glycine dehydrogenase subunit GcvPA [Candidatus Fermentibacterales bacterium]
MGSYIPNGPAERDRMLRAIGVGSIEDLLASVPSSCRSCRLEDALRMLPPASELEVTREFERAASLNSGAETVCFAGGGAYDHFIPAAVDHVLSRSEFYTAYTPYQAEASQGTLQCIYEFQTMIARLTGMDVANASMYDGASSVAEAALVAMRSSRGSSRVLVAGSLNPRWLEVLRTYMMHGSGFELCEVPFDESGRLDTAALLELAGGSLAALVVQQPNYFGVIEDLSGLSETCHQAGGMLIVAADPVAMAMLEPPGACGADLVAGEGQSMGMPMCYGGPWAGFMAARRDLIRKLPGRIIGATVDRAGQRGYVMTLQTREQHIRREKATSNICTNQALMALATSVYLSLMGETGFREVALHCFQKSHYLCSGMTGLDGVSMVFPDSPFFREFVVELPIPAEAAVDRLLEQGYLAGIPVPGLGSGALLMTATEKRTRAEIDALVAAFGELIAEGGDTR